MHPMTIPKVFNTQVFRVRQLLFLTGRDDTAWQAPHEEAQRQKGICSRGLTIKPLGSKPVLQLMSTLCLSLLSHLAPAAVAYHYTILEKADHNPDVFTQGFVLDQDWFYESSGHYGRSFLLRYPKSGKNPDAEKRLALPPHRFAEGITIVGKHLYLLSWKAGTAQVFDKHTFQLLDEYRYDGEGWGLTHDGQRLILSDGTDVLRFYSNNFALLGTRKVRLNGKPLKQLNELEYQGGMIWANRWQSNTLYAINARSGTVEAVVDLSKLHAESAPPSSDSVLNGIAYDKERDAFWITGKYWRHRYLLRFVPDLTK
jgi:glutaminyl-peptide cyclotransferase